MFNAFYAMHKFAVRVTHAFQYEIMKCHTNGNAVITAIRIALVKKPMHIIARADNNENC